MTTHIRSFITHLIILLVSSIFVLFLASDGLGSYHGPVVSFYPSQRADVQHLMVVIRDGTKEVRRNWPIERVRAYNIPADPVGLGPKDTSKAPIAHKDRFSLSWSLSTPEKTLRMPTTSTGSVAIAALFFFVGVAFRNMWISGSPLSIVPNQRATKSAHARSKAQPTRRNKRSSKKTYPRSRRR